MEKIIYVGSCQHDIDVEWYNSDDSSYLVLDESSGAYVNVTTCRACKDDNVVSGRIIDPNDVPMDNFVNPFADDPEPEILKVVNLDGSTTVVFADEAPDISEETLSEMFNKDLTLDV